MVSGNDHLVFPAPWVDGPMALAAVASAARPRRPSRRPSYVPALRHPVVAAKALAALDWLAGGRLRGGRRAGLVTRSTTRPSGSAFEDRWSLLDEAIGALAGAVATRRAAVRGRATTPPRASRCRPPRCRTAARRSGSAAGARRRACAASPGSATAWLASAYNIDAAAAGRRPGPRCRTCWPTTTSDPATFPNTLSTFWFHLADDQATADRVLARSPRARVVHRPEDVLARPVRDRVGRLGGRQAGRLPRRRAPSACCSGPWATRVAELERFQYAEVWPQLGEAAATVPP